MMIAGYIAAVFIGISLGMIGSGGSILTVPVLVYLMGVHPLLATTSSLFIVGAASLTGGLRAYAKQQVDFRAVVAFGIPSILSIFITRHFILPALPDIFFQIGKFQLTKGMFLMIFFAVLMLGASISMIRGRKENTGNTQEQKHIFPLIILGLFIGLVTGLLGAGGGFLIIPSLVLFLHLPMKTAVGTSLMIIAINSLSGFLFSLNQFVYNWTIILSFTAISIAGIFIGSTLADKVSGPTLKKSFGWFVLAMGFYIIAREIFFS